MYDMQQWEPGTGDDLIYDAQLRGVTMTERTLTLWRDQGLLTPPQRVGRGRARGVQRVYTAAAREVFNTVLMQRHDTKTVPLTRIVVGLWIYWGEDWVPWAQAERGLGTWITHYRTSPGTRATREAFTLVDALAAPDADPQSRRQLTDLVKQAQRAGRITDPTALTRALGAVIDPHTTGRRFGSPGNSVSPEQMVTSWVANETVIKELHGHLKQASKSTAKGRLFPPRVRQRLHDARDELRSTRAEYTAIQPVLAALASHDQARWAEPAELAQLLSTSCSDLLLAYHYLTRRTQP